MEKLFLNNIEKNFPSLLNNKFIVAVSGGVDSSVVAKLIHNAIGKKLTCIFVNTGLLRKNEEVQVVKTFRRKLSR